jgi:hypothetical protein
VSKKVFANGMGISAKKDDNKSICAMPDVCLSPPSPPAGPIPIPYPNTAQASDTSDGSKTVKIGGDEVGMKNRSNYKTSTGDEAATKSLGMGVVSHNIQGKMKHAAWSFDVKIEGANVIRHMDLTTHNHINTDNADLTINQELEQLAAQQPLTCNELTAGNVEAQNEELEGLPQGHAVVTAYRSRPGIGGEYLKAVSNQASIIEDFEDGYAPAPPTNNMADCQGGRTGRATNQRRYDAENKMLDQEIALGGGGSILMSTWHRPGLGPGEYGPLAPHDAAPCYGCRQAICDAETCGIEVYLCRADGGPPVRPAAAGLCPPAPGQGDNDPAWQAQGLGFWN